MKRQAFKDLLKSSIYINKLYYFLKIRQNDHNLKLILLKNSEFEGIHSGKRCFILGNGPSIKDIDLGILEDEITFSVNQLSRRPDFSALKTNYHIWMDERFFDIDLDKPEDAELLKVMKGVNTDNNKPVVFYRIAATDMIRKYNLDKELDIRFVDDIKIPLWNMAIKNMNFTTIVPKFNTVTQTLVCLAIYMGFSEIYLLGCDCTGFITTAQSVMCYYDENIQYAYEVTENEKKRMQKSNSVHAIQDELRWYADLMDEYENLYYYCKDRNIKLVNLTEGGLLNSIPRGDLNGILS